ncbi:MAG: bifunctional 5,10-methylenetetrahydrofolate dehydrogenase/5,10-methenyltetrahydrofolate cyclohydrolase [Bacilli bacterium]|nr:bifunctional 5,10-methylenetetrahydrofolate dehydrogenase/5,10-methenyltetrahydrofolate cyclohydrolase [Bacilli bacterium]
MELLLGKPIRELLKERIQEELRYHPISFYLYSEKEREDCQSYLRSIKKMLDSFQVPYREDYYSHEKSLEENLDNFVTNSKESFVLLARPMIHEEHFIQKIPARFDPDMLTIENMGKLASADISYLPATARSVKEILEYYQVELEGKNAVVIGRSLSVGFPCAQYLLKRNANVTILHSHTPKDKLDAFVKTADILVLASGKIGLIDSKLLDENKVIIDCGFIKGSGDLGFTPEEGSLKAYTPVPGGVGSLTSYCLLLNAIQLAKKER